MFIFVHIKRLTPINLTFNICLLFLLSPEECPFSCEYNGPPCCPFNGVPKCAPRCQTFVPCAVTPCPEECPDNCFYPDAGSCCPLSGAAVCRSDIITDPLPDPTPDEHSRKKWKPRDYGLPDWRLYPPPPPPPPILPPPIVYGYDHYRDHHHHHYDDDDYDEYDDEDSEAYEGLFIGSPRKPHQGDEICADGPKTVTDIESRLEFVTMTKEADDNNIICPLYIIPW